MLDVKTIATTAAARTLETLAFVLGAIARVILSPVTVALVCMLTGIGMLVAGVYVLLGLGAALLAGAVPFLLLGGILIRGVTRGA